MIYKIVLICITLQVTITRANEEDIQLTLPKNNSEVEYFVQKGINKFFDYLQENFFKNETTKMNNSTIVKEVNNSLLKIVGKERQYHINVKYPVKKEVLDEQYRFANPYYDCVIDVKTMADEPIEICCYYYYDATCFSYYCTQRPHMVTTCDQKTVLIERQN
ncbi:uncharacterized protein LOC103570289 [Microplitis demolitor]|uniref:uncharacterized protein LOC103570289 n=1 Tax=Microplitis demolitor TaxID=69319 RepID=UPI00044000FB|nr:uncharacterized protein LOC103570289 [Microplitis demolitor]